MARMGFFRSKSHCIIVFFSEISESSNCKSTSNLAYRSCDLYSTKDDDCPLCTDAQAMLLRWLSTLLGDLHQPLHWLLGVGDDGKHKAARKAGTFTNEIWMKVVTFFAGECHPKKNAIVPMVYLTGLIFEVYGIRPTQVDWLATPIGYFLVSLRLAEKKFGEEVGWNGLVNQT